MELTLEQALALDPNSISDSDLQTNINALISNLKYFKDDLNNEELAIKNLINSLYGATANPWFSLFDINISESITLQGQDVIKYSDKVLNQLFQHEFHLMYDLHEKLGIRNVKPLKEDVCKYQDTDSAYVAFDELLKNCEWQHTYKDGKDFILAFNSKFFAKYLEDKFKEYSAERKTDSLLNFELENISTAGIFLAKKKYVLDIVWKDPGVHFESLSKLKFTGIEVVQRSTPPFARKIITDIAKRIFREKKQLNMKELLNDLRKTKELFKIQNIEDISILNSCNFYEKYIIDDGGKSLVIAPKCQEHVRAAGYYNWMLKKQSKYRLKYPLIKGGDKIRFYHTIDTNNSVFAFLPGQFPSEFAPPVDYDTLFDKTIISPINRLLMPVVKIQIPKNLLISKKLF